MTTTQVETYVQERFNMGLREFIKQKIGVENLYDYEVADIMSVDSSLIGKLRKHLGLKKATVFPRQFERSYGEGAVERFKNIIEKPNNSLADAARHFGFCREYSRQVYEKIYGYPYTETFRSKRMEKRRILLDERIKPKRIRSLIKVTEKMESMGLSSHLTTRKHVHEIWTNGYKLVLRTTSKPVMIGTKRYFRISNKINPDYDFIICVCKDNEKDIHYVIPQRAMPKCGIYLIPGAGPGESKYTRFREAWDLLSAHKKGKKRAGRKSELRPGYINFGSRVDQRNSLSSRIKAVIDHRLSTQSG
ncbi:MAG: hypothetical protein KAJ90_03855 [Desulfobacterales bacterium]|nr:hypothetical protein [Desulfobacterales bacterium]